MIITAIKSTKIESKWFPLISCALGAIIAAGMFYVLPEFIGAASLAAAVISGAVSGLAATGTNQIFKQLMKAAENGEDITKIDITKATAEIVPDTNNTSASNSTVSTNVHKTNDTDGNPENK